ncbi:MAG: KEOPS complex subunit Pcc1 [Candidatus Micrarchaeota archaeon]
MKNSAELIIHVSVREAKNIISALKKENASNKRFSSKIFIRKSKLIIRVEANDIVSLRFTVNSYLRYLQAIENIKNVFKG